MGLRSYEILGAERVSGTPTRATIKAASPDEARAAAADMGLLISRVNDLGPVEQTPDALPTPAPAPELVPPGAPLPQPGIDQPMGTVRSDSRHVPDLDPLPGEVRLAHLTARGSQVGLLGMLLGHRQELILTTHRLIALDRQLMGGSCDIAPLEQLAAVRVGTQTNTSLRLIGLLTAASGLLWIVWTLVAATQAAGAGLGSSLSGTLGSQFGQMAQAARTAQQITAATTTLIGLGMMYASRRRVVGAMAGVILVGLRVRRLDRRATQNFVQDLQRAIDEIIRTGTQKP